MQREAAQVRVLVAAAVSGRGRAARPSVCTQHAQVVAVLEAKCPAAAAHLDDAREDILAFTAFTAFPCEVWRRIWSNTRRSG